jgi:glutamyl/glutaminyl-tRNA synthetase
MYGFAQPIPGALEGITHSLCSIEFENHRPLYDWVVNNIGFEKKPHQPTRFFSLDVNGKEVISSGKYMIGYTRGDYGQTNDLPERMREHAKKHNLTIFGPVYNIYLIDEISESDPNNYLLEVSVAVR